MARRSVKAQQERKQALLTELLPTTHRGTHFEALCAQYAAGAEVQNQVADNIMLTFATRQDGGPMFAMIKAALAAAESYGHNAKPAPVFISCETEGCSNPVAVTPHTKRYGAFCEKCQPALPLASL